MENLKTETQNETPANSAEYLRQLANEARTALYDKDFAKLPIDVVDIEAAADKIEQQEKEIEALTQQSENHQKVARDIVQRNNQFADAIMSIIGDRV